MTWKTLLRKHIPKSKIIYEMPDTGLALVLVDVDKLWEQDVNARTMTRQMFNQLTQNVSARGALESTPFCALTQKGVEIVSGHHRIRSLRTAKQKKPNINLNILILLDTTGLTKSAIAAKQLAHNSLSGVDDPQMLKQIYLTIDRADLRLEAFIDESKLELQLPEPIHITPLNAGFTFEHVKLLFLPSQLNNFDRVLDILDGTETKVYITNKKAWLKFKTAVAKVMTEEQIRSIGTAIDKMTEIVLKHYGEDNHVSK